jgi:predicted transcriptional regulator
MGEVEKNIKRAFELTRRVAAQPDIFPDRFIAIPLDPELTSVLSRERIRLLNLLREKGSFDSVNQLAKELGREQSRVSRDLAELVHFGLIEIEREGKSKVIRAQDAPIILT